MAGYYTERVANGDSFVLNTNPDSQDWYVQDRVYAGPTGYGYTVGYFIFDVSAALGNGGVGQYIFSARLRLYVGWNSGGFANMQVRQAGAAWDENTVTWNRLVNQTWGSLINNLGTPGDGYFYCDVTTQTRSVQTYSLPIAIQPDNDNGAFQVVSRDANWSGVQTSWPTLEITYGYPVTNVTATGGTRYVSGSYSGSSGASSYTLNLRRASDNVSVASQTLSYGGSYSFSNVSPGTYYVGITSDYSGTGSTPAVNSGSITVSNSTPPAPNLLVDNPIQGAVTLQAPSWVANTTSQFQVFRNGVLQSTSAASAATTYTVYNIDSGLTGQNITASWRAGYADGTQTAYSAVSAGQPVSYPANPSVTFTPTSGVDKSVTASWSPVPGTSGYSVQLKQLGVNYGAATSQTALNKTWFGLPAGTPTGKTYDVVVTAQFSSSYGTHGESIPSTTVTTVQPTLPIPPTPTALGNTPFKRAVRVTTLAGITPTNGTISTGWDALIDANPTLNSGGNSAPLTFWNQADGNHTVKWRYTWADGDKSAYSPSSAAVATTTPPNPVITTDVSVPRTFSASWGAVADASGYSIVYNAGGATTQAGTTYTASGQISGSKSITVTETFSVPSGETFKYGDNSEPVRSATASATVIVPQSINAPVAAADTPYRRAIRVTMPYTTAAAFYNVSTWDVRIRRTSDNVVFATTTGVTPTTTTVDIGTGAGYNTFPDGTYYADIRANWADGDLTAFSPTSNAVTTSTPTQTGLSSTVNAIRTIQATWTRIADAASYSVTLAGTGGSTQSVANPGSGTTVSYTWSNVKSGNHTVTVTPVYTNGYLGPVNLATGTGTSLLPTPLAPTVTGDSPAKRQLATVTNPSQLPSAYYTASSWEFLRDGLVNSGAQTTVGYTFSATPQGSHTVQVRANWADGDVSQWSASSAAVQTTSPPVTGAVARQRNAPTAVPLPTTAATGGTIPAGTYYIAVATNRAGNAATDVAAPAGETTRLINESTPSPLATITTTGTTSTITVPQPTTEMFTGDTWNIYIGTDRNSLRRAVANIAFATTTSVLTSYTAPSVNDAKIGKSDLLWVAPAGVADAPLYYKVERAPAVPSTPTGAAGAWSDITSSGNVVFYASNLKFIENKLDTKYWFYRVTAVYTGDTSASVEITV